MDFKDTAAKVTRRLALANALMGAIADTAKEFEADNREMLDAVLLVRDMITTERTRDIMAGRKSGQATTEEAAIYRALAGGLNVDQ